MILRLVRLCTLLLVGFGFVPLAHAENRGFVASSLVDFAQAAAKAGQFELNIVAGGSSTLARQIEAGAPADLFISANREWAQKVAGVRALRPLFGNNLVLVADQPRQMAIDALPLALGNQRLAMADPQHVPAGIYAQAALAHFGLWSTLSGQVAAAENVRSAARFVQRGAAPFGVVYGSDARALDLPIVFDFPEDSYPPIRYWAVKLKDEAPEVDAFLSFLASEEGHKLLVEFGFQPIERTP